MAALDSKDVFKINLFTVREFAEAMGISDTACYNAIASNLVDHTTIGDKKFICDTTFTTQYKPNESPRRKPAKKAAKVKKHTRKHPVTVQFDVPSGTSGILSI